MAVETGGEYFSNFRVPVVKPDSNRVPSYIRPETVEVKGVGPEQVRVIGGPRGIDINI